jgi:DNA polymerase III psi subunit
MTENYFFLPQLINEGIYLVKEPNVLEAGTSEKVKKKEESTTSEMPLVKEPVAKLPYQGRNKKKIVVLVCHPDVEYSTTSQELLLRNILTAMNLSMNDIALINVAHAGKILEIDDVGKIGCEKLIAFGVGSDKLSQEEKLEFNQIMQLYNMQILMSYSLDDLQHDKEKKMMLWRNLKVMFNL